MYHVLFLSAKKGADGVLNGSAHPKRKQDSEQEHLLAELEQTIVNGKKVDAARLSRELLKSKMAALDIIDLALVKGMNTIGDRYAKSQIFLPQVLQASEAMYEALDVLLPKVPREAVKGQGLIVIGVVEGDVHDIGKNILKTLLTASGFDVMDLGRDVPPEAFTSAVRTKKAQVVAMSTLMTPTMDSMKDTVDVLVREGLRSAVVLIIGGAPTSPEFAREIGVDLHAANAQEGTAMIRKALHPGEG